MNNVIRLPASVRMHPVASDAAARAAQYGGALVEIEIHGLTARPYMRHCLDLEMTTITFIAKLPAQVSEEFPQSFASLHVVDTRVNLAA